MKKGYQAWNKDGVEDQKNFEDLNEMAKGKIERTENDMRLNEQRNFPRRRQMNNNNQQKKKY